MDSVNDQKSLLRKEIIKKRGLLSTLEWKLKSDLIKKHVIGSKEFIDAQRIHCFISMNDRFEVDTLNLIEFMLSHNKEVVVPITNFKDGTLSQSKLNSLSVLKKNKWGVLEPEKIIEDTENGFDLILVPLLAADRKGNRLGYGKGFYDRFLIKCKAKSFGLVFNEFILKEIPTDMFDIKLSGLISEKGFIYL